MKIKYRNLIFLLFFFSFNITIAEEDERLNFLSPENDLSTYSENILVSAIENIKKNKIELA